MVAEGVCFVTEQVKGQNTIRKMGNGIIPLNVHTVMEVVIAVPAMEVSGLNREIYLRFHQHLHLLHILRQTIVILQRPIVHVLGAMAQEKF